MGRAGRLHWLRRLAATSALLIGGTAVISPRALDELLEEAERLVEDETDCLTALRVLAQSERPRVRALVAEAVGVIAVPNIDHALKILRDLTHDSSGEVREAAGRGLTRRLERASPAERIEIACDWALSPKVNERAAIASAIAGPMPLLVTDMLVEQLARDDSAEVRTLALRAAASHANDAPDVYKRIARECLADRSAAVRREAETLLSRLS